MGKNVTFAVPFRVIPVMRIRHDHQFFIYHAPFKHIRAIANQFSLASSSLAAFDIRFLTG